MALADLYSDQAVEAKRCRLRDQKELCRRSKAQRTREQDGGEEEPDGDLFDEL